MKEEAQAPIIQAPPVAAVAVVAMAGPMPLPCCWARCVGEEMYGGGGSGGHWRARGLGERRYRD